MSTTTPRVSFGIPLPGRRSNTVIHRRGGDEQRLGKINTFAQA